MIVTSFDCGTKHLGVVIAEVMTQLPPKPKDADPLELVKWLRSMVDSVIRIKWSGAINMLPTKRVDKAKPIEVTQALKGVLLSLDAIAKPELVLIEYQMGPNHRAGNICAQIMMHYAQPTFEFKSGGLSLGLNASSKGTQPKCSVRIVKPGLKNSVSFKGCDYQQFISKYSNWTANKKHTVCNFKKYCELTNQMHMFKDIPDVADAFMMLFAFFNITR